MLDLDPDRLGRVDRGAAAERDETVAAGLAIGGRSFADELDVRVRAHAVEEHGVVELRERRIDEPGRGHALVGDEQRPRDAELAAELAEPRDRAGPVHHPRRHLDRAHRVDLYGQQTLLDL